MRISDWSSDVCSSDLVSQPKPVARIVKHEKPPFLRSSVLAARASDPRAATREEVCTAAVRVDDPIKCHAVAETSRSAHERGPSADREDAELEEDGESIRSEEHTSELQSLMRTSYAVLCLKNKHNKR